MADVKTIKVSADGVTYYVLPGNTGDFNIEKAQLDDTIYGSAYSSSQPGITDVTISANAMYRGFAGYQSIIRRSGATATVATGEAMSQVDSSQTYRIDDTTKNVWDHNVTAVIYDNGSQVAVADIESVNYLFGEVTFVSGYTVTGPITADISFWTMATYGRAQEFTLTQTADTEDVTVLEDAQSNSAFRVYRSALKNADLELSGFYSTANNTFDDLKSEDVFVIEIDVKGDGKSLARGYYKITSIAQSAGVAETETSSVSMVLSVPEGVEPFGWYHAPDATIPMGLRVVQGGWVSGDAIKYQYFPEGDTNPGYEGDAIVTDASITSGVNSMVEGSAELQGIGECFAV